MQSVRIRKTGAIARLGRTGFPHLTSATGGTIDIVTGATQPGFNPIDLLYASLASCMAMSARIAASRMGMLDQVGNISVTVCGNKAEENSRSRIAGFHVTFSIDGDIGEEARRAITDEAEKICTVSNTLASGPAMEVRISDA